MYTTEKEYLTDFNARVTAGKFLADKEVNRLRAKGIPDYVIFGENLVSNPMDGYYEFSELIDEMSDVVHKFARSNNQTAAMQSHVVMECIKELVRLHDEHPATAIINELKAG